MFKWTISPTTFGRTPRRSGETTASAREVAQGAGDHSRRAMRRSRPLRTPTPRRSYAASARRPLCFVGEPQLGQRPWPPWHPSRGRQGPPRPPGEARGRPAPHRRLRPRRPGRQIRQRRGWRAGDSGLIFARWDEAMARQESLAPTRALPAPGCLRCYPLN